MEKSPVKKIDKKQRAIQRKKEAKRKQLLKKLALIAGITTIVAVIIFVVIEQKKPLPGKKVAVMEDQSHIKDIYAPHTPYNSDPPTSGKHVEYVANWGVHKEPVPKEVLVHNLEDGGVVIYYNKNTDRATVEKLEKLVNKYRYHVLLTPYPEMENTITLTAWGRIDKLNQFDDERIDKFIQTFKGVDHH